MHKLKQIPPDPSLKRPSVKETPLHEWTTSFALSGKHKSYKQQFSNIYYQRLHTLKGVVQEQAAVRWQELSSEPKLVERVLEVEKGQLCYIIGTVYLEMPMKPNILEDIARDHSMPAPPRPDKIYSPEDSTFLEDESGRIRIIGDPVKNATLVTGLIISALGMESNSGDFEVLDLCFCGLAPQPTLMNLNEADKMEVDGANAPGEWIAIVSGLDVGSKKPDNHKHDIRLQLLVEYLASELGSTPEQQQSTCTSRLIIAGDSFAPDEPVKEDQECLIPSRLLINRAQPTVPTETHPTDLLGGYLLDIGRSMPIHIMPGDRDPAPVILPQQPFPRAMLGSVKQFKTFKCETNPSWYSFEGCQILGTSGQPLHDMCLYVPDPEEEEAAFDPRTSLRLSLMKMTLECRHLAPTAPDTLHCFPYKEMDPFALKITPHLYFHGNQPQFETELVEENGIKCRLLCIPRFAENGQFVLFNVRTLDVKLIEFDAEGMGKEDMPG